MESLARRGTTRSLSRRDLGAADRSQGDSRIRLRGHRGYSPLHRHTSRSHGNSYFTLKRSMHGPRLDTRKIELSSGLTLLSTPSGGESGIPYAGGEIVKHSLGRQPRAGLMKGRRATESPAPPRSAAPPSTSAPTRRPRSSSARPPSRTPIPLAAPTRPAAPLP